MSLLDDYINSLLSDYRPASAKEIEALKSENKRLMEQMDKINNITVGWQECGPYEDANTEALQKMTEIYKLSLLPEKR